MLTLPVTKSLTSRLRKSPIQQEVWLMATMVLLMPCLMKALKEAKLWMHHNLQSRCA